MILDWLRSKTPDTAYSAYTALVEQARQPAFYINSAVPDTLDGRFDMIVMHIMLIFRRFNAGDEKARAFGQHIFDIFIQDMDRSLREIGVGDVSIPKKMKKIGRSYYGRSDVYTDALDRRDPDALADAIDRNIFTDETNVAASQLLAGYMIRADDLLAGQSVSDLLAGKFAWPALQESVQDGSKPTVSVADHGADERRETAEKPTGAGTPK